MIDELSSAEKAVLKRIVERADLQWNVANDLPVGTKMVALSGDELAILRRLSR